MGRTRRWVWYVATLGVALLMVPQVRAAEAETKKAAATELASKPAGPKHFLDAVPEDAWAFAAIRNLADFDKKLGLLTEKLSVPFDSPLAMLMGQFLGIGEGLRDTAGLGVIILDPMQHGMPPGDIAVLVPTTDAKALLEVLDPQDAGEGMTKIDLAGYEMFAATKGGFVVVGQEQSTVKYVAAAKKGIKSILKPDQIARYEKADIFAMLNLRPVIMMAKPFAGQYVAMMMMDQMDEDPTAGERIQETAQWVVDFLDQINSLEIALGLDDAGIQLSLYLTFQEGGTIAKKIADAKPAVTGLLGGLPKDQYVLAMGLTGRGEQAEESQVLKMIMDQVLSQLELGKLIDKAKMEEVNKIVKQLMGQMGSVGVSFSMLPEGGDGMVCMTKVAEMKDPKGSIALYRKIIELVKTSAKDEETKKVMGALSCKPGAEKVGDVPVDVVSFDLAAIAADDPEIQGTLEQVKKVLGKEGVLVRVAPAGEKRVVAALGGGAKRFETVLKDAAAGKRPLAEDPGIVKVRQKMPKKRMFEMYVAVDRVLKLAKAITGSEDVPMMEPIDAPLGISLATEKNYGRLDLIVPTELIVQIKNVVLQALFGGGFGGGAVEPSF